MGDAGRVIVGVVHLKNIANAAADEGPGDVAAGRGEKMEGDDRREDGRRETKARQGAKSLLVLPEGPEGVLVLARDGENDVIARDINNNTGWVVSVDGWRNVGGK
jgi:hypothetical protein